MTEDIADAVLIPKAILIDLHGYPVWQAVEVATEKIQEAWDQGVERITFIHGSPGISHHRIAMTLGRGGIKWSLRSCLARGDWNKWVFNRRSKKHVIEAGAMTLALRPKPFRQFADKSRTA